MTDISKLERRMEELEAELARVQEDNRRRRSRHLLVLATVAVAGVTVVGVAQPAMSALHVFSPGTPAQASRVNENFAVLQAWIEQKAGAVNTPDVAVPGTLSASGTTTLNGGATVNGGTALNGGTTLNNGTSVNGPLTMLTGTLFGRDGTTLQGGLSACGATGPAGCVLDNTGAGTNRGRVNADSFHTNGLGAGQMFIEGASIDSNQGIYIGAGNAGGMGQQDVHIGGDLHIGGMVMNDYLRNWISTHCRIEISWTDFCDNASCAGVGKWSGNQVNGSTATCRGNTASGGGTCLDHWARVNSDGDVDGLDTWGVAFICDP